MKSFYNDKGVNSWRVHDNLKYYVPNNWSSKFISKNWLNYKMKYINPQSEFISKPISIMWNKEKNSKYIEDLNNNINQLDVYNWNLWNTPEGKKGRLHILLKYMCNIYIGYILSHEIKFN